MASWSMASGGTSWNGTDGLGGILLKFSRILLRMPCRYSGVFWFSMLDGWIWSSCVGPKYSE